MTPETIHDREKKFAEKLTDSSGKTFTAGNPIDIGDGFTIRPISPGFKTYFYQTKTEKTQICLHFTVGVITGDIASLTKENNHMSVPYVVDRCGNIYRLFDESFWSYHLGSSAIGGNAVMSKQSIGIEISNYGPLKEKDGKFIDAYGNTYTSKAEQVDSVSYRGYNYYAKMTDVQKHALAHLLKYLSEKHGIPLNFKEYTGEVFASPEEAVAYRGVFCHSNVRKDKFDLPPEFTLQIQDALNEFLCGKEEPVSEPEPEPVEEPVKETPSDEPNEPEDTEADTTGPDEEQVPPTFWERVVAWLSSIFNRQRQS
jgi:hypothetical protein